MIELQAFHNAGSGWYLAEKGMSTGLKLWRNFKMMNPAIGPMVNDDNLYTHEESAYFPTRNDAMNHYTNWLKFYSLDLVGALRDLNYGKAIIVRGDNGFYFVSEGGLIAAYDRNNDDLYCPDICNHPQKFSFFWANILENNYARFQPNPSFKDLAVGTEFVWNKTKYKKTSIEAAATIIEKPFSGGIRVKSL